MEKQETAVNIAETNKKYSQELHDMLLLRYEPIAVKMIKDLAEVPENAVHPKRDMGKHMSLCQAYALTRRNKKTIFTDMDSEWCWCPIICMGYVDSEPGSKTYDFMANFIGGRHKDSVDSKDAVKSFFAHFPRLPYGKYKGIVSAPLCDCGFEPDLVLIYANPAQTRIIIGGIKQMTGKLVETKFDVIDSCAYDTVMPLLNGEYRITFPDPGEYERALSDEDEVITSVPRGRIAELIAGLRSNNEHGIGYKLLSKEMMFSFPRPQFYNEMFQMWGLNTGEVWEPRNK
jgi:uncharacterized protein (DUF169 family)